MKGLQAAIKLVQNLLEQFEPEDAQIFAAFVLAKVSQDGGLPIQTGMQAAVTKWAQLALAGFADSGQTIDGGNCTCNVSCVVKQTNQGPLVIHYGAACLEFRNRFPLGGPTRAQDGVGWNNWYASEKQDPPGSPKRWEDVIETSSNPNHKNVPTEDDSASIRFGLLELDPP